MDPKIDLAKLVGAASAPVALIIASSIFLSNLTTKNLGLSTRIRELLKEIREKHPEGDRGESLQKQAELFRLRIAWLQKATFWLTVSIICFIVTVVLTAVGVVYPDVFSLTLLTGGFMLIGLILLAYAVCIEAWENHLSKAGIESEVNEGTQEFHAHTLSSR